MNVSEIIKILEEWAPKGIAWEKDNVGLQVGDPESKLKNIMLSLDLSNQVIDQAIKQQCNFIFTHHPILYHPLKNIDLSGNPIAKMIGRLIKNNITLYSAHTNLDFTKHGVSYQLAKRIGLRQIKFLRNLSSNQIKLVVFVPVTHLDKVADAIHKSGAGLIGEYSYCGFRTEGTGTFKGSHESNPVIGSKGNIEYTEEVKLEVLVEEWKLSQVLISMKKVHPYEEVAYDIYPLKNENVNFGIGAIGELESAIDIKAFLHIVSSKLKITNFRYSEGMKKKIKTVAVCGGSCGELIEEAISNKADAFVTADLKYHSFRDAESKILLIDAGHYETEVPVLDEIQRRLKLHLNKNNKSKVLKFKGSTSPLVFFNKRGAN